MRKRLLRAKKSQWPEAVTVKQVAERAGVSTATVSRVLSGHEGVAKDLSKKVLEAARALNYQPNRAARQLRAGSSRIIGVLIPDIENPFYTSVVRGIEEVLNAQEYSLLLADYNEDAESERIHISNCRAEGIAGLIFSASRKGGTEYVALAAAGLPMVAVSRLTQLENVDQVTVDNEEGARIGTAHLLGLGYRRIAMITGPRALNTARERYFGFVKAFHEAALPIPDDLVVESDFRQAGGYQSMRSLLAMRRPPEAVFVGSNLMTLGALEAIHERNLDIPGEIAVVGFDDLAWAASLRPPLTTIAQPTHEVGRAAAGLLLERLSDPARPRRHLILQTRLVVRSSCGAPQSGAAPVAAKEGALRSARR